MVVNERAQPRMEKELDLLYQLDHPNVIKMFVASHASSPPLIVFEDAINGDLGSFLARSDDSKKRMWRLLYQAALGLNYIHEKGVVHGDLKLNNILVDADGQAKLSNFGLSSMRVCVSLSRTPPRSLPIRDFRWSAPECKQQQPNAASDVYALAMCMIEAAAREPLFALLGDDNIRESPAQLLEMNDDERELVISMTCTDPLQNVIEKMKGFARKESTDGSNTGVNDCSVCFSKISNGFRFCSQCGTPEQSSMEVFEREFQPHSPVIRESHFRTDHPRLFERSTPVLATHTSVYDLVRVRCEGEPDEQEDSLPLLYQAFLNDEGREHIYEANGISVLIEKIRNGNTHFIQACAMGSLAWTTELDSKLEDSVTLT